MVTVDAKEADMVFVAMQLDKQLEEKVLPLHEMQIIALYHPEEETQKLAGKAIVTRILKSDEPEKVKAARLSGVSTDLGYHIEAREGAGKALCEIIRKAGAWEKSYSMAMDSNYPPETRAMAASDFLDNSKEKEGVAAILGCLGISEKMREERGFKIVRDALENGNMALVERIGAYAGLPLMLALYIKSITGSGAGNPRFAKERKSSPPPRDLFGALETTRKR
ncbi:MAG: hypothetical protein NTY83_04155 [Candidatus Micrarchaeota archaeon]|nr:hypothetical protein [Candidatus Micrarchaeota archaeon]